MTKTWRRRAVAEPRAVLSVAFSASDFALVDRAAEAAGVPTSAFVRAAALDRVRLLRDEVAPVRAPAWSVFGGDHERTGVSGHL